MEYANIFKSLPANQQQQLAQLQPEVAAEYLYTLQNQNKKNKKKRTTANIVISEDNVEKKRRKGSDPRKCYNPTCDKIVTKRNYCYKCQKRKERGLALNPKLPSIKQLLLPSDKKQKNTKMTDESPQLLSLPNLSILPTTPSSTLPSISSIPTPSEARSPFVISSNSPFSAPQLSQSSSAPQPFSSALPPSFSSFSLINPQMQMQMQNQPQTQMQTQPQPQSSYPVQPKFEQSPFAEQRPILPPTRSQFSANPSAGSVANVPNNTGGAELLHLHQYLLQLSNGSEEKANLLLNQYLTSRSPVQTPPMNSIPQFPNNSSPFGSSPANDASKNNAMSNNQQSFFPILPPPFVRSNLFTFDTRNSPFEHSPSQNMRFV